jgi:multiple sugar transport system substrate-binding protein
MHLWRKGVIAVAISVLMLGSFALLGIAQDKPYSGVVLHLACMADQYADYLKVLGQKFEAVSGARVEVDILGYTELYQKITQDYATHTKQYDLATTDIVWTGEFAQKEWTVDLTSLILRDYEEINVPDILPVMWAQGSWEGKQVAFPMAGYANSLIYRKDLFNDPQEKAAFKKQYGYELHVPRTIDELRDVATFFTRPKENLYGLAANGARGPAVAQDWMEYMRAFGGQILDSSGNVVVDSPQCIAALQFFVDIFDKWAPPGAIGYWWDDRETSYRTGQSVMESSWSIARAGYEDPSISLVVGKTGMALTPAAPAVMPQFGFGGWGIAINADVSEEKQAAAWAFIKWIASPETQKEWMLHNGAPIRLSTLLDPELNQEMPWLQTMLKLFISGNGDYRPRVPQYSRIQDILGLRINQAITHELTPEEALNKAAVEIKALYAE